MKTWIAGAVLGLLVFPVQWLIIWVAALSRRMLRKKAGVTPFVDGEIVSARDTGVVMKSGRRDSIQSGISDTVAGALVLNKRNVRTTKMAKGMTKLGADQAKKEMRKIGTEFQRKRMSVAVTPRL